MLRTRWSFTRAALALVAFACLANVADARITRIEIVRRESPTFGGMTFGDVMAKTTGEEPSGGRAILLYAVLGNINPRSIQRRSAIVKPTLTGVRRGDARTAEPLRHGRRWPRRREARG